MTKRLVFAVWLVLLVVSLAHAADVTATLKWGSTFPEPPQVRYIMVPESLPFALVDLPPWARAEPMGGVGPTTIAITTDKRLVPAGLTTDATVRLDVTQPDLSRKARFYTLVMNCSQQSGCGDGPLTAPTSTGTAAPRVTSTARPSPGSTAQPTAQPTAIPTADAFDPPVIAWRQVSISPKIPAQFLKWCPSATGYVSADQVCADAMEGTREMAATAAMRLWAALPGQADEIADAMNKSSGRAHVVGDLWPCYRTNFCSGKNDWGTDKDGKLYSIAYQWSWRLNQIITRDFELGRRCASFPESTMPNPNDPVMGARVEAPLLDFLDLRIEHFPDGDRCVYGARFPAPVYPPSKSYDKAALKRGLIDYEMVLPPLTGDQAQRALDTHHAHHDVTAWHCGAGPQPALGIVAAAHRRLLATCRNPTECKVLDMIPFSGVFDPAYSPAEKCAIAKAQDAAHGRWVEALLRLNGRTAKLWLPLELANIDHAALHAVANFKHPLQAVRLFEGRLTDLNTIPREYLPDLAVRLVRDATGVPLVLGGGQ